MFEKILILFW